MPASVTWSTDVDAGAWIAPRLHPFATGVGSVVPDGFASYARLLHPAWSVGVERRKVRWRELAASAGVALGPATQYEDVRPRAGLEPPLMGSLERDELDALVEILGAITGRQTRAWFAVWDGYGWLSGSRAHAELARRGGPAAEGAAPEVPRFELPHRSYLLYHGALDAATVLHRPPSDCGPNLWWDDDRSWCVASEIDLRSTYVGGPLKLNDALRRDARLETLPVAVTDRIGATATA